MTTVDQTSAAKSPPQRPFFGILRELGDRDARRAAAHELAELLEQHSKFSFLRIGDGEIQWIRAMREGQPPPRYKYPTEGGVSVEYVFSVSGMEHRHYERFMKAVNDCSYLDYCDNNPPNLNLLPTLGINRTAEQYRNRSPETGNIIFEWTWFELKDYLHRHRVLFASAEAALMRELHADPRFRELAADFWPADAEQHFHQIRNDGRNFSENLDLIKEDLRKEIAATGADTLILSLASGAKILCYELAEELGIRCIDFGSLTRALTYAATPGYHAHRNFHNPFMFRVPLDVFMPALERAQPNMPLSELVAKAHCQMLLDLQDLKPLAFNPSEACRGGGLNMSRQNMANFRDSLAYYNSHYRARALHDPQSRTLHRDFRRWCLKQGIGWDGKVFRTLVWGKGLLRKLGLAQCETASAIDGLGRNEMNEALQSDWLSRVAEANRRQIYRPPVGQLARQRMRSQMWNWRAWYAVLTGNGHADYARNWTTALNLLGAELMHRVRGQSADLEALHWAFDQRIDRTGRWTTPINSVRHAMQGYPLLYLVQCTGDRRYGAAADALANMLKQLPRAADGSLLYSSESNEVLVDTLAMVCPFLARHARMTGDSTSRDLAVRQLERFVEWNLDEETELPFHGYVAGGARRLGLLAWGRGVGWYLLGLVDTIAELQPDDSSYGTLREALQSAIATLVKHQRPDGHWNWAILQRPRRLIVRRRHYWATRCSARGNSGIEDTGACSQRALEALITATLPNGLVDGGLGECRGLGIYPQTYGPQPWLQGTATAFGAIMMQPPFKAENKSAASAVSIPG